MKTRWLIEVKDARTTLYYAGYEVRDKEDCPSGSTEAFLYKFTEDVYSAKKFISKRLAADVLSKLPTAIQILCNVFDHGFCGLKE